MIGIMKKLIKVATLTVLISIFSIVFIPSIALCDEDDLTFEYENSRDGCTYHMQLIETYEENKYVVYAYILEIELPWETGIDIRIPDNVKTPSDWDSWLKGKNIPVRLMPEAFIPNGGLYRSEVDEFVISGPNITKIYQSFFYDSSMEDGQLARSMNGFYGNLVIDGVKEIGVDAFRRIGNHSVIYWDRETHKQELIISDDIEYIGDYAFYDTTFGVSDTNTNGITLEYFDLDLSHCINLRKIGDYAFGKSCYSGVTLPKNIQSIGKNAFAGNTKIKPDYVDSGWFGIEYMCHFIRYGSLFDTFVLPTPDDNDNKIYIWRTTIDGVEKEYSPGDSVPTVTDKDYIRYEYAKASFVTNTNDTIDDIILEVGEQLTINMIPIPVHSDPNMVFLGWYRTADFQSTSEIPSPMVEFPYTMEQNETLYAKWSDKFIYEEIGSTGTARILNYEKTAFPKDLSIPQYLPSKDGIGSWLVVEIADEAFMRTDVGQTSIVSLVIPDGVKRIGKYSFYGHTLGRAIYGGIIERTNIRLSESIEYIGSYAFYPSYINESYILKYPTSTVIFSEHKDVPDGYTTRWRQITNIENGEIFYDYYLPGDTIWGSQVLNDIDFEYVIKELTVTYNGNNNDDGTVPLDNNIYTIEDNEVTVLGQNDLTRDNYTFIGWEYIDEDGESTVYYEGDTFIITDDTVLYAVWEETQVSNITLNETELVLGVGETFNLNAVVEPYDAFDTTLIWSCDNSIVATIAEVDNNNYTITTNDVGRAEIMIFSADGGSKAICNLTVQTPDEPISQIGNIRGNLVYTNNDPLAAFLVTLFSSPVDTLTNSNGEFNFNRVNYATHTLILQSPSGQELDRYNLEFIPGDVTNYLVNGHDIIIEYTQDTVTTNFNFQADSTGFALTGINFDMREYINPQTGDMSENIYIYFIYGLIALVLAGTVILFTKKYRKEKGAK